MEASADRFEVSPQQEKLWRQRPEGPAGRTQAAISIDGPLDTAGVRAALGQIVSRHESLRTTFVPQPGMRIPFQVIHDRGELHLATLDLTAAGPEQTDLRARARRAELAEPIDLAAGPLARALLVSLGEDRHELVLTLSDLCADSASGALLVSELCAGFGEAERVVDDPLQYADFSAWQRSLLGDAHADEAIAARGYWGLFDDARTPSLPFTKLAPAAPFMPEHVPVELSEALSASIATTAVMHAAWHSTLAHATGEPSVVVAYLSPQRRHADLEGAIGAFAQPVPIRTEIASSTTFAELLREVEQARTDASIWQDYAPSDGLADVTVGFLDYDAPSDRAGVLSLRLDEITRSGTEPRLWLSCARGEAVTAQIWFDPRSYARETVEQLAVALERTLTAATADAETRVSDLELLDESDRRRVLCDFNATQAPVPDTNVHDLIAAHAAAVPDGLAVVDENGSLTYAELDARSNQLANRLRRAGVGPDVTVGLCTDRSTHMIVGLLGILKAGGAYVPLHYEHPKARLGHQLETAAARAVVTQSGLLSYLPELSGDVVCLDDGTLDSEPRTRPDVQVSAQHLVYVIYTSGSTGTPKGVGVTHGNLVNYATAIGARLGSDVERLTFGLVTSISTDLGNTSVFGALCSGGTLVLVSPTAAADASAFARQVDASPIDVLKITPSHIGALLAMGDRRVLPRRWLVIGGERAPWDLVTRVRELSDTSILNHYGPTETTVGATTFLVGDGPGPSEPATVPIGRPLANTACYVLDPRRRPVPVGVPGRLYIGGAGVAKGYVGASELTEERFVPDPFAGSEDTRMYDTGDLARWLPDGALEFLGRNDEQLKIRGYRVEPAEVESALRSHPNVNEAVVVAQAAGSGEARLFAYCTVTGAVEQSALLNHLAAWLPEFMLPSALAILDALPRTASGKVDLLSLADTAAALERPTAEYVAPRTPVEQVIGAIWSQTLGVDRVGVHDDFFALGGHSLLAMQVVAQVRSDFAVDLPLHSLFTCPTVEMLAAEIVHMMGESEEDETAKLVRELEGLSDTEAEALLASEAPTSEAGPS